MTEIIGDKVLKALRTEMEGKEWLPEVVLDLFASERHKELSGSRTTRLDDLLKILKGDGHTVFRSDIVKLLRALEKQVQQGQLVVGRRGHPTRFEWAQDPGELAKRIIGELPHPHTSPVTGHATGQLVHSYILRPSVAVQLVLPGDLTSAEARRLADFILTLPFQSEAPDEREE